MRYNEIITELFDQKADWHWEDQTNSYWNGAFALDGRIFSVSIDYVPAKQFWDLSFAMNGTIDITGTGDEYIVFGTIKDMMLDFINQMDPDAISFGAKKTEPSRMKLYDRMAALIEAKLGRELTLSTYGPYKMYILRKPNVTPNPA